MIPPRLFFIGSKSIEKLCSFLKKHTVFRAESYWILRSATAGSFLEATSAGNVPAKILKIMLSAISATPEAIDMLAKPEKWMYCCRIWFVETKSPAERPIPRRPEHRPMITDSAQKVQKISHREAPMLRRMPISWVRSSTEM